MIDASVVRREQCPRCSRNGRDRSENNLNVYSDGGAHCFVPECNYTILSETFKQLNNIDQPTLFETTDMSESFNKLQWENIKERYSNSGRNFRGINDDTYKLFSVYHKFNEDTGQVQEQYYPLSENYRMCGIKIRFVPKDFVVKGTNKGITTQLFGQSVFRRSNAKSIVICSGEIDSMSAYQMLLACNTDKRFAPTACVSSTVGEGGWRQIQAQYEFLDRFERILICPDQDPAGLKAVEALVKILPKDKIFIMELPKKDANKMLELGLEKEFINCFFKAKPYTPQGIIGSFNLYHDLIEDISTPKLPLPPFMAQVQKNLGGGIKLHTIMNLVAASGVGKAQPLHSRILTPTGWIPMGLIRVGDNVLTPSGEVAQVLGVYPHQNKPVFKFLLQSGATVESCTEHIWQVCFTKPVHTLSDFRKGFHTVTTQDIIEYLEHTEVYLPLAYPNRVDKVVGYCFEGCQDVQCIYINHPDHLYVTDNYIVTHNTTYINELVYYWIFNSPYRVGVVSLELSSGQYAGALASRHLGVKLNNINDVDEVLSFLQEEKVVESLGTLFKSESGGDRFHLIVERSNTTDKIQKTIEQLIIGCGCQVIVIDPLQDLLAGLSNDEQELFMNWMKDMVLNYPVIFANVCHIRKSQGGKEANSAGAAITEEDVAGSSSLIKSSSLNLLFTRNKYAEDSIIRNTTEMSASKNRQTGITGPIGSFYYCNDTHRLHDLETYKQQNPELFASYFEDEIANSFEV